MVADRRCATVSELFVTGMTASLCFEKNNETTCCSIRRIRCCKKARSDKPRNSEHHAGDLISVCAA